jgi:hypothetical protein
MFSKKFIQDFIYWKRRGCTLCTAWRMAAKTL